MKCDILLNSSNNIIIKWIINAWLRHCGERSPRQYVNEWVMAVSKKKQVHSNLLTPDIAIVGDFGFYSEDRRFY